MVRKLAWAALALQGVYFASWLVAAALEPGYSAADSFISELAAKDAENPWLVRGGVIVAGLSFLALAEGVRRAVPRGRVAAALFALAGVGVIAAGLLPLDCAATADAACEDAVRDGDVAWTHWGHLWAGVVAQLAILGTPFALAAALWSRPVAVVALGVGLAAVAIGIALNALEWGYADGAGYVQRAGTLVLLNWVVWVAIGLLAATRTPGPAPRSSLGPREVYTRDWNGEGEIVLRPLWLGRRFPMRFTATRSLHTVTDELLVFHDRAEFDGGYVHDQRRWCRMRGGAIEVDAGDLPEGARIELDEEGYRILPYRLLTRAGPFAFTLDAYDVHRPSGDGIVDEIDLLWLGVPAARVTVRATPVDGGAA
jgi:hypothetical protein